MRMDVYYMKMARSNGTTLQEVFSLTYSEYQKAWMDRVKLYLDGRITKDELDAFGSLENFMELTKEDRHE